MHHTIRFRCSGHSEDATLSTRETQQNRYATYITQEDYSHTSSSSECKTMDITRSRASQKQHQRHTQTTAQPCNRQTYESTKDRIHTSPMTSKQARIFKPQHTIKNTDISQLRGIPQSIGVTSASLLLHAMIHCLTASIWSTHEPDPPIPGQDTTTGLHRIHRSNQHRDW